MLINLVGLVYLISKVQELEVSINGKHHEVLTSFNFITKQIQKIPKEITVKNVLNIP